MFDFSIIRDEWHVYLQGLGNTVWLVGVSLIFGLCIAVPMALCRNSENRWLRLPAWAYIYFFRGTPMLVQLFMIYYGAAQWSELRDTWAWRWFQEAWFCALLCFSLNTAAYTAEIIRDEFGVPHIYGAVTTGTTWRFLKLQEKTAYFDMDEYYLKEIET